MSDAPEQKSEMPTSPVMPPASPPTVSHRRNPVWMAALLGGLLGAVFSFALSRTFPTQPKAPPEPPKSEVRQFADDLIALLRVGKNEEFLAGVRQAFSGLNDEQFNQRVRQGFLKSRSESVTAYGPSTDFEFVRETSIGPNLVRFAYLEKFPHGCVVWIIVLYNTPEGWQVLAFTQLPLDAAFQMLR
jgi:hypothetical protein